MSKAPTPSAASGKRHRSDRLSENLSGFTLIAPNLIGFLVFTLFGIIFSLTMAFTDWNLIRGYENASFVGLDNFKTMFKDIYLRACLINNAKLLLLFLSRCSYLQFWPRL